MADSSVRVQIDRVNSHSAAVEKWEQRRREPGVFSCCFLLMEEERVMPKAVLPEVWHVHTVYHAG